MRGGHRGPRIRSRDARQVHFPHVEYREDHQEAVRVDTPILPRNEAGANDEAGDVQAAGSRGKSPAPADEGARDKAPATLAAHDHNRSVVEGEANENEPTSSVRMCVALPDGRLLQVPAC